MPQVSLIKGKNRREITRRSLERIAGDIETGIRSRQIVIKPNFVSSMIQLASSHVDQIRGILDFLAPFQKGKIIVAEAACYGTWGAYRTFGYTSLIDEYDVELVDLNDGPSETLWITNQEEKVIPVKVSRLLLDTHTYLISAAKVKTHDTVVVTLSIKNTAIGSIVGSYKKLVHQGMKYTNVNIADMAQRVWPDLAVIDGFEGMEGEGPTRGTPVDLGVAIASIDPLAADRVACEIMGVDLTSVGYLMHCSERSLGESDLNRIEILGEPLKHCIRPFRLHSRVKEQYAWKSQNELEQYRCGGQE